MAYTVTLQTPDGTQTIQCEDDQFILDAAEEAGALHRRRGRPQNDGVCDATLTLPRRTIV